MEPAPQPKRLLKLVALAASLLSIAQALAGARLMDYTYDEPFHLDWARRLVFEHESERRSITNFDSKTPMTAANVLARYAARRLGVRDSVWLRFAARLPGVLWLAGLFVAVFLVVRARFGLPTALVALTLVAADPNLSAHAGLVTVDVVYALASFLVLVAALALYARPSVTRCLLLALAFAFAFTAKFTGVLLLPVLALPLLRLLPRFAAERRTRRRWRRALLIGALCGSVLFVLCVSATYGFLKMGRPLGEQTWSSAPMSALARLLPRVTLPLPGDFLSGIDICLGKERAKQIMVGILGHRDVGPVPYYFVASWLLKTPVLLLATQLAGLWAVARRRELRARALPRLLAAALVLNLLYLSFVFRYQIGYRYAFMCLPLVAVLAAAGLTHWLAPRALGLAGLALVITAGLEQLPFVGNGVAFSNALVQPKRLAFRLLGHDSNLDYGQHREQAARFLAESPWAGAPLNPIHPLPGLSAFTVSELGHPRHTYWLARVDPLAHLHHTVLVFRVSAPQFAEYIEAARSPAGQPEGTRPCGDTAPRTPPDAGEISLADGDATLGFSVTQPTDLVLTGRAGSAHFGPAAVPRRLWDPIEPGAQAWYRLRPGTHLFGVMRARSFRAHLRLTGPTPEWCVAPGWRFSD